jgi:hypothetical protein
MQVTAKLPKRFAFMAVDGTKVTALTQENCAEGNGNIEIPGQGYFPSGTAT